MSIKLVRTALVLAFCSLGLAACGDNSEQQAKNTTPVEPETTQAPTPAAKTELVFWHAMEGSLGKKLNDIVEQYNQQSDKYHVTTVFKGGYGDTMNAGIAAYRAQQAPDIIQIFEVGTASMIHSGGAIKPVSDMAEEVHNPIDTSKFIDPVASYYSYNGKLYSMPFNSSTPVLYYNKSLFEQANLPDQAPKTFAELRAVTKKLKDAGTTCTFTSGWPSWVFFEVGSALNNVDYASKNNGFDGLDARLQLDQPYFKKVLTNLAEMSKEGTFTYGGRDDNGSSLFISGKCAIYTGSSASIADFKNVAKFPFSVSTLPYFDDLPDTPQNTIIGGASLWVFNGKEASHYEGITDFFHFLMKPEISAEWSQATGYLPVVKSAYELGKTQGYYTQNPEAEIPILQLNNPNKKSRALRLGSLPEIRTTEESEMEAVFTGSESVENALKNMQEKSNQLLDTFEQNNQS